MNTRTLLSRASRVCRQIRLPPSVISRSLKVCQRSPLTARPTPVQPFYTPCRSMAEKGDGMVINIQDEADFENRVLKSVKPVVVDFHATWCGPCKVLGPRLESLIGSKGGKVILAKVDVDDHMELATRYKINSVPTVIGFKNKVSVDKFVGVQDDVKIDTFLEKLIG
ncbi:thioredoxin, mitochondrial-like [Dreissena polymorpha]|uniref:Thioredoxin domain-containing protein n=1 Tax=Dreissena polymorpha TaxID=45954 RepID=A0A9D4RLY2_DREPO|nr:thioredoxin, mitochondrial-like [Dreissena polymorpha]KAH3871202.1 hypothetical protein DPMN_034396 [Dreissena polymorpha]